MFDLIKITNAKVGLTTIPTDKGTKLEIIINDRYKHTFSIDTRESRLLNEVEIEVLRQKFNGGTFIFSSDGKLVDYRTSDYKGFIHNEDAIRTLSEKIGFSKAKESRRSIGEVFRQMRETDEIFLGGLSEPFYLDIASLGEGGSFKNQIVYKWSPFNQNIVTTVEVERLVCLNGMVAMSPLITQMVPVLNDWERHLEIVSLQIQPNINNLLQERFVKMADTHASVTDVQDANRMLRDRSTLKVAESATQLEELIEATKIESRLKNIYRPEVFNGKLGRTASSDLTQFDLFNILTEATSHTAGSEESNRSIQKFINKITFDMTKNEISGNAKISEESDHRRVFFGTKKKGDE
jgi:hypothetical protein